MLLLISVYGFLETPREIPGTGGFVLFWCVQSVPSTIHVRASS